MSLGTSELHQPCAVEMARLQQERDELRRTARQLEEMTEVLLTACAVALQAGEIHGRTMAEARGEISARLDGLRSRMRDMPAVYGRGGA